MPYYQYSQASRTEIKKWITETISQDILQEILSNISPYADPDFHIDALRDVSCKETKNPKYNQPESKDELNHVITMKDLAKSYVHSSDLQMERGIL